MPLYFKYDPNDPKHDSLLAKKRAEVRKANRDYAKYGIAERIRLTYSPRGINPKFKWKYSGSKRRTRLEDAKEVAVYWSTRPVRGHKPVTGS